MNTNYGYPMNYQMHNPMVHPGEDRIFAFPFLVGALTGGAAVGLTRPRPIYNVAPVPYYQPYPAYPPYQQPYYSNNYYYNYPYYR